MALGIPVFGSDIGGIRELIVNVVTGLLYESGNLTDLKDKILLLKNDKQLRMTIAESARNDVVENRDWLAITKRYNSIYKL